MANDYENILVEQKKDMCIITLNRPKQMNALNLGLVRDLRQAFGAARWEEDIKVIILTGKGEKGFCAGLDLKERAQMNEEEILDSREQEIIPLFHYLGDFPKPIIGAINGVALGGGAELALVCDIRIAAPNAGFGQTEIRWGMNPSAGACQRLRVIAGIAVAKELIFTGRKITAEVAHNLGIYSRVVPFEELLPEALKLGEEIAEHSRHAHGQAKKVHDFGSGVSHLQAFDFEASKECFYRGQAMAGHKSFVPGSRD
ncbi:MAG: enoyl-CoA hydratase/isomerase family protein [Deltaproteobacteria bacterium]|nr:enoyl-CoA hydratase/isomerase family protein [Deltaproteobacteria bacterium]